jgi:hypothetical protein
MDFINKLDPEQQANANKIADEAIKIGVDPRLAVALAFQESGLRHGKTGEAGEIGIMQVRPTTAKMIGFEPKELNNPDRNIQIGLTYLKQGVDRYKDPVLAAAGYNAGMDHPFFADPTKELPKSTMSYLESIKGLGGFTGAAPQAKAEPSTTESTAGTAGTTQNTTTSSASEKDFQAMKARALVDIGGTIGGAAIGKGLQVGQNVMNLPGAFLEALAAKGAPEAAAPVTSGEKWARNWAGQNRPGIGSVPEASAAYQRSKGQGPVSGRMTKMWGAPGPGEPTALVDRLIARGQTPPPQTALQQAGSTAKNLAGAALRSPVLTGGLGGLGAAEMGMQFMERVGQKDPIGAAIAGVGALGSTMGIIPHPAAKIVGGGLAAASPLTLYLYDKMRQPGERAVAPGVDLMNTPMP